MPFTDEEIRTLATAHAADVAAAGAANLQAQAYCLRVLNEEDGGWAEDEPSATIGNSGRGLDSIIIVPYVSSQHALQAQSVLALLDVLRLAHIASHIPSRQLAQYAGSDELSDAFEAISFGGFVWEYEAAEDYVRISINLIQYLASPPILAIVDADGSTVATLSASHSSGASVQFRLLPDHMRHLLVNGGTLVIATPTATQGSLP